MNLGYRNRVHWAKFIAAIIVVSVVAIGGSMLIASAVGATQDECNYRIQPRDTLSKIATRHGTTYQQLAARNGIANPNMIYVGDHIDICQPGAVSPAPANRPVEIPGRAISWAESVQATRPAWATDHDVRFAVAVAGPESQFCNPRWIENRGDAAPPTWGPSVGCIQVRTFLRASDLANEPWRNRAWLEADQDNVAEAMWVIMRSQGKGAWGPARHATGIGVKLPPNGDCSTAASRSQCESWWQVADLALANIECRYPLVDFGDCP